MSLDSLVFFLLTLAVIGYAVIFGWLSLERYYAFEMHALDMGNMGQAAWNTVHGHPFVYTNMRLPYDIEAWHTTNRLSFHVEALFPVISLAYLIYGHPESLLLLQTAALAAGAFPVYFLARDVLQERWLALTFGLAYLLYPSVEGMNLYEFHAVALATPLLLFAFYFAYRRRYVPFALCALAAMGTKEEIGLVVAMFGLYIAFIQRERRIGLITMAVGISWSLFAVVVVEHHFRHPPTRTYLQSRYPYLGHGVRGVFHALMHPDTMARVVFTLPKLSYVLRLLAPMAFLGLLAPWALLLGAPTWALNLLSTDSHMYSGLGDNSAELISVTTIASILGARAALRILRGRVDMRVAVVLVGVYLLAAALWNQRMEGFTPMGTRFQVPRIGAHQAVQAHFVAEIPPDVPISTQDQLDPALSSRRYLYLFADTGRDPVLVPSDRLLLDVSANTYPLNSDELHDYAMGYLRRAGWGVAAAQDGLILIEKGPYEKSIPPGFFTYAHADGTTIPHRIRLLAQGLSLLGYASRQTDLSNHYIPSIEYEFYVRPSRRSRHNVQPVLFEVKDGRPMDCASHPLGLAWLPTSHWEPGRTYIVRFPPMETAPSDPTTVRFFVALASVAPGNHDCSWWWLRAGSRVPVGTLRVHF